MTEEMQKTYDMTEEMQNSIGHEMYQWASELFPYNRSLTGKGVRETLTFIQRQLPQTQIFSVPSGTKAFDWTVPQEWSIQGAWISDLNGNKLIDFRDNNLHVMSYSIPINKILTREELEAHLYSLEDQPDAIPYITSYYKENFGFCLSQNQRKLLGNGPFHVFIDSKLFSGNMNYAELLIPGDSKEEILFSTYVCHPSMANNELSGPVVAVALAKHIESLESRRYSYRFLFTVENIGTTFYISKNLEQMKSNILAGWVLTCMGDDRSFSYVPTRSGKLLTDFVSRRVLKDLGKVYKEYLWIDGGSDERRYNAPGIELPIGSLMRTMYGEYPEYHTSLDNLDLISPSGLYGGLHMMKGVVQILETNGYWKLNIPGEPQLGIRGLYPNISTKSSGQVVRNLMNVISYLDGKSDLLDIAEKCQISYEEVLKIVEDLINHKLLEKV